MTKLKQTACGQPLPTISGIRWQISEKRVRDKGFYYILCYIRLHVTECRTENESSSILQRIIYLLNLIRHNVHMYIVQCCGRRIGYANPLRKVYFRLPFLFVRFFFQCTHWNRNLLLENRLLNFKFPLNRIHLNWWTASIVCRTLLAPYA